MTGLILPVDEELLRDGCMKDKKFESKNEIVSLIKILYSSFTSSEKPVFEKTNSKEKGSPR